MMEMLLFLHILSLSWSDSGCWLLAVASGCIFSVEKQKIVQWPLPGAGWPFCTGNRQTDSASQCLWLWLCCLCQLCPRMTSSFWTKDFEPVTFVLPTAIKHKCASHQPSSHARRRMDWKLTRRLGVWVQAIHHGITRNFLKWKQKDNKFTTLIKMEVTHIFGDGVRAVRRHGPIPYVIPLSHFDPNT